MTGFDYRLKREIEHLGGDTLVVESLADLNETIDALFAHLERRGEPEKLERLAPYFGVVWPSARALAEALLEGSGGPLAPHELRGKRVLEIGCGLAIPSLLVSRRGAFVLATDSHPEVPFFLERNLALNPGCLLEYRAVDWEEPGAHAGTFDLVIGSDILYERAHPARVAAIVASHLAPGGRALIADPGRSYLQAFADEMKARGFEGETSVRTARDAPSTQDVFMLSFEAASRG